ncbi:MAG TPA: tetratricopeptide repeat protein [Bacteroidetes bacterium]|nr:tetratricopeptide repeat protein [Bacteroidota bacterium]
MLFILTMLLLMVFFLLMLGFSFGGRKIALFLLNLAGALAVALSFALELSGMQTKVSLIVFWVAVTVILLFDLIAVLRELRLESHVRLQRPEVWRRFLRGREYKVIYDESRFSEDLERQKQIGMTEKLQALEMWRLGNQAFLQGSLDDAIEKYDLSIRWCPTSSAWINRSAVHFEKGEFAQVIECCDEAIKLNPDREEAWINRALAFLAQNDPAKALKSLEEALVVNPNNPETLTLQGNTYRRLGKLEESLASYKKANDLAPEYKEAWFQKGLTLNQMGRLEEAVACFRQAIELDGRFAAAYYHLANTLNKLDRNKEAVEAYRKSLKLQPNSPEAWNNLGIALTKLGRIKEAIRCYEKAISLREDYYEAWLNCGIARESQRKGEEAIRCYEKFLELAPDSLARHKAIAQKHLEELKQGRPEKSSGKDQRGRKRKRTREKSTADPASSSLLEASSAADE